MANEEDEFRGDHPHSGRVIALMQSFPTLAEKLALPEGSKHSLSAMKRRGFNPGLLDSWACGPAATSGSLHAARFVLSVWRPDADRGCDRDEWKCGYFRLHDALGTWDAAHRQAFLSWAKDPWWP